VHARPCLRLQDAEALLALKAAVIGPDCTLDSRRCAIFDTWSPGLQPCSSPFCKACTLEHGSCGTPLPYGGISCNWRYIECNANGRVRKIVLGESPCDSAAACGGKPCCS
jgi:hypothetical protein